MFNLQIVIFVFIQDYDIILIGIIDYIIFRRKYGTAIFNATS